MNSSKKIPGVSVVVVGWNNCNLLEECFQSVLNQTYKNVDLIYVDNGSDDGSIEYVSQKFPQATIIDAGRNTGFAVGNNLGIAHALQNPNCQNIVALNSDARLAPDWVVKMVAFADIHPDAACLQGLTLNYHNPQLVDSAGIYIDMNAAPIQIGYGEEIGIRASGEVFGVNAAAALYTRQFLDQQPFGNDYFDHDLFMYYEDVDICARALSMGMKNYFNSDALAYHMGSVSSGGNPTFMLRMTHRNLPLVLIKNLPFSVILACLRGWRRVEYDRLVIFRKEHRYDLMRAMLLGRLKGLLLIPKFIIKRRRLFRSHRPSATHYYRLMRG